jgi:hypothetical protein
MLERVTTPDDLVVYRSPLLARHGIPHAFSTRMRPSESAFSPALARAAGLVDVPLVTVIQVHGAHVVRVDGQALPDPELEADALVSTRADVFVGVHTADCVPLLFARADGSRVAAVHAGWRGLVAGVIPRALAALEDGPLLAAIGPCLSRERFEVGPEVVEAFEQALGLVHGLVVPGPRKPHIDLRVATRTLLERAGVAPAHVDDHPPCTRCDAARFFSFRRDGEAGGVHMGFIGLDPA